MLPTHEFNFGDFVYHSPQTTANTEGDNLSVFFVLHQKDARFFEGP